MNLQMNLKKRSLLMIGLILFFTLSINTAILTYISYKNYKNAILANATARGNALINQIENLLLFGLDIKDINELNKQLKDLTVDETIGYAMILDREGKALYHSQAEYILGIYRDSKTRNALSSKRLLIQKLDDFYDISSPLMNAQKETLGVIRIGVISKAINEHLYKLLIWAAIVSILGSLLFGTMIFHAISRFITDPIMEIEKVSNQFASGDLTVKVKHAGTDEISTLAASINNIAFNSKDVLLKIKNLIQNVSSVSENITESPESVLKIVDLQKKAIEESARHTSEMDITISSILRSADSLRESAGNASHAIGAMTSSISDIAGSSYLFNTTSHEAASSIQEMITSMKEVAESIGVLYESSEDSAAKLVEVESATKEIHQNAEKSVTLADRVSIESSEKGLVSIHKAIEGMEDIRQSMDTISKTTRHLENRSREIETILSVLREITDQTTLLSLNAAIQAAQAGEHGKGFSVIAREVKNLSDKASSSTKEIAEIIGTVQEETRLSVQTASQGIETVEKGVMLVGEVKNALSSIFESSKASTEMSRMIQRATTEQTTNIKEMTDTFRQIAEKIKHISYATKEQMAGSTFILEVTDKIKTGSEQLMLATEEQSKSGKQLLTVSENVSVQAEQIKSDINNQKQKSDDIVSIIKQIQKTTEELMISSEDMEESISTLSTDAKTLLTEIEKFKI